VRPVLGATRLADPKWVAKSIADAIGKTDKPRVLLCYPKSNMNDLPQKPLITLPTLTAPWVTAIVVLGILAVAAGSHLAIGQVYAGRILPGVTLLGINVGGEKLEDARNIINKRLSLGDIETLALKFEDQKWDINPTVFGFRADINMLVSSAHKVGRSGKITADFNNRMLAIAGRKHQLVIESSQAYSFDRMKLATYLDSEIAPKINQEVQDAKLVIVNKRAKEFVPDRAGRELDTTASVTKIAGSLLTESREIELAVNVHKPEVSLADTNKLGIHTLIAHGESNFAGSPKNRRHNIATGAAKFDGLIFDSGEVVSFMRELGAVDASTGFLPELVIKNDTTTPEFGGGLCQVSTTAFRAVLYGGLTITERRNHSYRVVYYEPAGTDATVYDPYPDMKFTNDTPGSLLVDTYIEGNKLVFDFYGTDTGRKVEVDGPHISNITMPPDPIYIDTSTLAPGEEKKIETAHNGATAVVYRKVYDRDGELIHNDTIKSFYVPWAAKYLRGVAEAAPVETNLNNIIPPASDPATPPTPPST
jgi:vancomycin resistance protein YoaR